MSVPAQVEIPRIALAVGTRVVGGLLEVWELRRWSAMLNALVLALFVAILLASVVRSEVMRRRNAAGVA